MEAKHQLDKAHQLNNNKIELELWAQILDDIDCIDCTHRELADIAWNIHKSIVCALLNSKVSYVLNESGKSVSIFVWVKVLCYHNEQKMMNDIVSTANYWKSLDFHMLNSTMITPKTQKQEVKLHSQSSTAK